MKYFFVFLSVFLFSTISCKNAETYVPCSFDSTYFTGVYKITEATIKDNEQAIPVDDYSTWSDCEKDDLFAIDTDGTITFSEGNISCVPESPTVTYEWKLNCNQFYLVGHSTIYTISGLSADGFYMTTLDPNDNKIHSYRYTRQ